MDGSGSMQGVLLASTGGIDAPNVDFVFDPAAAEKFKKELGASLVLIAWWWGR